MEMLPSEFLKSLIKKSEAILLKQNKTNNNKNGGSLNRAMMPLFITLIYTIKTEDKEFCKVYKRILRRQPVVQV